MCLHRKQDLNKPVSVLLNVLGLQDPGSSRTRVSISQRFRRADLSLIFTIPFDFKIQFIIVTKRSSQSSKEAGWCIGAPSETLWGPIQLSKLQAWFLWKTSWWITAGRLGMCGTEKYYLQSCWASWTHVTKCRRRACGVSVKSRGPAALGHVCLPPRHRLPGESAVQTDQTERRNMGKRLHITSSMTWYPPDWVQVFQSSPSPQVTETMQTGSLSIIEFQLMWCSCATRSLHAW